MSIQEVCETGEPIFQAIVNDLTNDALLTSRANEIVRNIDRVEPFTPDEIVAMKKRIATDNTGILYYSLHQGVFTQPFFGTYADIPDGIREEYRGVFWDYFQSYNDDEVLNERYDLLRPQAEVYEAQINKCEGYLLIGDQYCFFVINMMDEAVEVFEGEISNELANYLEGQLDSCLNAYRNGLQAFLACYEPYDEYVLDEFWDEALRRNPEQRFNLKLHDYFQDMEECTAAMLDEWSV